MHEYTTAPDWGASGQGKLVPAYPPSRRLTVLRQFARDALAEDALTFTPLGDLVRETDPELVLDAYLFAGEGNAFEQLSASMTIPNGWQALLGGDRAALIHGLRRLQARNWRDGTYQRWLTVSYEQLATLAGVSARTVQRWLAPGPALDVVLSDYMKALDEINPVTGRHRKPAKAPLRNALLKLFIREKCHTSYETASGERRLWRNRYRVLPIDPLPPQSEQMLFSLLGISDGVVEREGGSEGEVEMPLSAQESVKASGEDMMTTRYAPQAENRFSAHRFDEDLNRCQEIVTPVMLRHNDTDPQECDAGDAATRYPGSDSERGEETEVIYSGSNHLPVLSLAVHNPKEEIRPLPSPEMSLSRRYRDIIHRRKQRRDKRYIQKKIPLRVHRYTQRYIRARARAYMKSQETHQFPASNQDHQNPVDYAAWCAAHAEQIACYRREITAYLHDFQLGDQKPASTATRCARLLAGAETPFEQVAEILYEAYKRARTGRGSHLVKRDIVNGQAVFRRTPRFLGALQALLGGEANPAYLPMKSPRS